MTIAAGRRLGPYEVIAPLGAGGIGANAYRRQFAATKDGQQFLVNIPTVTAGQPLFTVLVNWPAAVVR